MTIRMHLRLLGLAGLLSVLVACSSHGGDAGNTAVPGSDSDTHGCKASAGYSWCARSGQCERPWELAASQGFDNTAEAFATWCGAAP